MGFESPTSCFLEGGQSPLHVSGTDSRSGSPDVPAPSSAIDITMATLPTDEEKSSLWLLRRSNTSLSTCCHLLHFNSCLFVSSDSFQISLDPVPAPQHRHPLTPTPDPLWDSLTGLKQEHGSLSHLCQILPIKGAALHASPAVHGVTVFNACQSDRCKVHRKGKYGGNTITYIL